MVILPKLTWRWPKYARFEDNSLCIWDVKQVTVYTIFHVSIKNKSVNFRFICTLGVIILKFLTVGVTDCSPEIWLLDRSLHWAFLASSFQSYFRMLIVSQYLLTTHTTVTRPNCLQNGWLRPRMFCCWSGDLPKMDTAFLGGIFHVYSAIFFFSPLKQLKMFKKGLTHNKKSRCARWPETEFFLCNVSISNCVPLK